MLRSTGSMHLMRPRRLWISWISFLILPPPGGYSHRLAVEEGGEDWIQEQEEIDAVSEEDDTEVKTELEPARAQVQLEGRYRTWC